jgi:lysophospholipase L1-like esterase
MSDYTHENAPRLSRRNFAFASATLGASAIAAFSAGDNLHSQEYHPNPEAKKSLISPGDTILFQGDSITDAGRKRGPTEPNSFAAMGTGYAWLAAAQLLTSRPDAEFKIFNRGISGNKVYQLAERWQADSLDLKPNVLSILIGVNDYWHKHNGNYDGTLEKYETDYHALVERTKDSLPQVKLVICEPFVLKVGAVDDSWFPEFDGYRAAARRVAEEAGAIFVTFQTMFDRAAALAPPKYWAADGVHPTTHGAALMAGSWLAAVGA